MFFYFCGDKNKTIYSFKDRRSYRYIDGKSNPKSSCYLPKEAFQTATTDRGKEFDCSKNIEDELGVPVYFAAAYSPCNKASNEKSNGLLRKFFPKKANHLPFVKKI